jgi:hypothetical protein
MLETKNFAYIHTSRTGGTFTNAILKSVFPESRVVDSHLPLSRYKGNRTKFVSTIRNPFDWYVSAFHFYKNINHPLMTGVDDFDSALRLMLQIKGSKKQHCLMRHDWRKTSLPNLTNKDFLEYPDNIGYYSWLSHRMTGLDTKGVRFMRFESLTTDLIDILKEYCNITAKQENMIFGTPHKNTTERSPYREYYSDELIDMVYAKDNSIFEKFGYEF